MSEQRLPFGPRLPIGYCPGGADCGNLALLYERESVERDHERALVRELAAARLRINRIEAELSELRDPEELRADGVRVRKDRWQSGIRRIAAVLGMGGEEFEIPELVERVRAMVSR